MERCPEQSPAGIRDAPEPTYDAWGWESGADHSVTTYDGETKRHISEEGQYVHIRRYIQRGTFIALLLFLIPMSQAQTTPNGQGVVIGGYAPLTFDLSKASMDSPPMHELRSRIPEGRPRLFVTPDTLDDMKNKRRQSPIANLIWTNLRTKALGYLGWPMPQYPPNAKPGGVLDVTAWREGIAIANEIVDRLDSLGFIYLMTGDLETGEAGKRLLLHVSEWDPYGNSGRSRNDEISMRLLYTMSRAYDWLHPLFTDEERVVVQNAMRERGNDVYTTMRRIGFETRMLDNHLVRTLGFLGQAAIAFMGELPEAEVWFDYVVSLLLLNYPPFGGDEGGWSQGVSYWQSYVSWLLEFMDALRLATGLDLYQMPFFRNTGYFKLYAHPPESKFGAFGDHSDAPPDAGSARLLSKFAMEYGDPALQWYVDRINRMGRVPDLPTNSFIGYVWAPKLTEMPPMPALPDDFPQSRLFGDIGWALMNVNMADWANNVHVKLKSSPYGSFNHSHAEQNSFQIEAYGSPLAIPSGYYPWYGSPHHAEWTWQSKSKNTILVNGQGQGAQSIDAKGQIVATSFGPQFDYVVGDATQAYMGGVERFLRHLLFVKPNLIVIYDQLEQRGRATTYDWLLHSVGPMSVDEEANRVLVEAETSHMWVSFVTPDQLSFAVTDQFPVAPEERAAEKPDQWHLTATAQAEDGVGRFLTVLVPRPNSRSADEPPVTKALPVENGHAVEITMDALQYSIAFRDAADQPLLLGGEVVDAAAWVGWGPVTGENPERGFLGIQATQMQVDGRIMMRAPSSITFALWIDSAEDTGTNTVHIQLDGDAPWVEFSLPVSVDEVVVNGKTIDSWTTDAGVLRVTF